MSQRPAISIVVPVYNEEESLQILHAQISAALEELSERVPVAEVIYVDDCSTDRSLPILLEIQGQDARVKVVKFRRNYGQTAAMAAGFSECRGEIVITLDSDLQNDPADIPRMVYKMDEGYDVVAGWRKKRHDGFVLRLLPSKVANRLIAKVTGVSIHDTGCTLKAFRGELVRSMDIYAEQHRFLPVLSASSGARVAELVVNHRARQFGSSKYGIGRAPRVLIDLVVIKYIAQFSRNPIQFFGMLAFGAMSVALLFGGAAMFSLEIMVENHVKPANTEYEQWQMAIVMVVAVLLSSVVYFTLLGLLSELAVKASGMHRRSTLDRILNELHG
jgi:glycosyltransferase involved in cell wall biosynthesis